MESIPEGYKKTKLGVIPQDWEIVNFGEIFERVTRRNTINCTNVLTISAQYGLINQQDFFNKSVASKDLSGYILLKQGEFAYNKSYSKGYPMGAFKRLNFYDKGVLSSLYIYFKIKNDDSDFYEQYFEAGLINKEVYKIAQEGARNHGLLNMSVKEFFSDMLIIKPSLLEQQKIAEILTTWDNAISKLEKLITSKEQLKKGLMQKWILSDKWKVIKLNEILHEHKNKSTGNEEVYSVSVHKGLVNQIEHLGRSYSAKDTSNYNLVFPHDIVYTKSPTGNFPYGIVKENKTNKTVIVSPLYGVFTSKNKYISCILDAYFTSNIRTNNYLHPLIQKGAKNTMSISNSTFLSRSIKFPITEKEQQKIAQVLSTADKEIELLKEELEELKEQKKGLMQRLLTGEVRVKV